MHKAVWYTNIIEKHIHQPQSGMNHHNIRYEQHWMTNTWFLIKSIIIAPYIAVACLYYKLYTSLITQYTDRIVQSILDMRERDRSEESSECTLWVQVRHMNIKENAIKIANHSLSQRHCPCRAQKGQKLTQLKQKERLKLACLFDFQTKQWASIVNATVKK